MHGDFLDIHIEANGPPLGVREDDIDVEFMGSSDMEFPRKGESYLGDSAIDLSAASISQFEKQNQKVSNEVSESPGI